MDIRSTNALSSYAAARPATQPQPGLGDTLASLSRDFAETLKASEGEAQKAMSGDADPHALVQALAQTELAVETVVTVRNRVVEAYQEILRMPV
jgi:flagellar hook-basal body complex protein FliE